MNKKIHHKEHTSPSTFSVSPSLIDGRFHIHDIVSDLFALIGFNSKHTCIISSKEKMDQEGEILGAI